MFSFILVLFLFCIYLEFWFDFLFCIQFGFFFKIFKANFCLKFTPRKRVLFANINFPAPNLQQQQRQFSSLAFIEIDFFQANNTFWLERLFVMPRSGRPWAAN